MNHIREWRQRRGWSLQRLAEASGTSKSQIDKLEKGARRLTVDWMVRLARPLGCDPRELMLEMPMPRFAPIQFGDADSAGAGLIPVRNLRRGKNKTHLTFAEGAVDRVPRPYYLAHAKDAYAILVAGDAMAPMYRPRQLLFVNPYKAPAPGGGTIAIAKNGAVMIREFVRSTANGVVVREYRPRRREITLASRDIAGLHAVVGTVEA